MGLVRWRGRILWGEGTPLAGMAPYRIARLGVGYVPENRRIFTRLSVADNLAVGRHPTPAGQAAWTRQRIFSLFPDLARLQHRRGGEISGGEQQMLAIARTLMTNPRLLLLDEPSAGLAPRIVEHLADTIAQLKMQGLALLVSEQNPMFAEAVADRGVVIEAGRVRWSGTMAAFAGDEGARRAVFGLPAPVEVGEATP
jgi:branched-chain amino acid transport system ATP-binding protein